MVCPVCKIICRVGRTYYKAVDDDTPDKPTRIFIVHELVCRNRACPKYNTVVEVAEFEQKNGPATAVETEDTESEVTTAEE